MNSFDFTFCGAQLMALGSGALFWPGESLLVVSDLHLGKSERRARLGEAPLPPYETRDTLDRLERDLRATKPATIICLGDSFDDNQAAAALPETEKLRTSALQAGRQWIWIEGNHDPGPVDLGGSHRADASLGGLTFRHIASPEGKAEISGHYHPKLTLPTRGRTISRPAFLMDDRRLIMPAYGTYTGGLRSSDTTLQSLLRPGAVAILTGPTPRPLPMPRSTQGAPSLTPLSK